MLKKIRKYWRISQITWQEVLAYRGELFLWTFIDAMPVLSMLLLWLAVYRYGDSLEGFSLASLITYFIVGHLVNSLVESHFELQAVDEIINGTVSRFLLKPFSYLRLAVIGETNWKMLGFIAATLPLSIALLVFLREWILLPTLTNFLWMLLFVAIAYWINLILSSIIVSLAFFLDQGKALSHFKWMISGIFSGSMLPLSVYPAPIEKVARQLPFQFSFAIPLEIYLGRTPEKTSLLVLAGVWILLLTLLSKLFWKKALTRFTAVGA